MADDKNQQQSKKVNPSPGGSAKKKQAPEPSGDPEGEKLQKKVDPLDHAIAETLILEPGILGTELAKRFDIRPETLSRRRHRPVFLRYMVWLRKDGIELMRETSKKAAQRVNEALDAVQGSGNNRKPDYWVRIAAARIIMDMNYGKRSAQLGQRGDMAGAVPGIPQEEVPALAGALVLAYRGRRGRKLLPRRKPKPKKKPTKKKSKPKPKPKPKPKKGD
ncbi:MAG: hypothetical protein V3T54_00345 [Acidobacteriota bacterium]